MYHPLSTWLNEMRQKGVFSPAVVQLLVYCFYLLLLPPPQISYLLFPVLEFMQNSLAVSSEGRGGGSNLDVRRARGEELSNSENKTEIPQILRAKYHLICCHHDNISSSHLEVAYTHKNNSPSLLSKSNQTLMVCWNFLDVI